MLDEGRETADLVRHIPLYIKDTERLDIVAIKADPMIAIMWQFEVKDGRETEFEELYGVDGAWTSLNRRTRSYLGTSFLRDQRRSSRYIVIEYWSEMVVYERHQASRAAAIASLERRRTPLVTSFEPLGIFTALDVPDRTGPAWSQRR